MSVALESTNARPVKLTMRSDLTAHRQIYQGQVYWVLKEPVGLNYFRFPEDSYFVLRQLDGKHSLEEIEAAYNEEFRPRKLTIDKLQSFVGSLHKAGLLQAVATGQGEELLKRRKKTRRQKLFSQFGNILAVRFRGIDPERILTAMNPFCWWMFTIPALIFVLFCGFLAVMSIFVNWDLFMSRLPTFNQFFDPVSWGLLAIVLGLTKVLHEFGHGLSCKRFGGECHEMGFMLLVLTPCLYCNVSDSWTLPNKWHRATIGAAGIYVELILATIATFIWWHTEPGMLNNLCLQMMTICSISTVLFNGNPLLRFDGYYILSDILEIPNLQQKATQSLTNIVKKKLLGIENVNEQMMPTRNIPMFALYAIASIIYRWLILFVILLFLDKVFEPYGLQVIGRIIAVMSIGTLLGIPGYKVYKFLKNPGMRYQIKMRRALISSAVIFGLLAIVLSIPLPYHVYCEFTVRAKASENLYVQTPGEVQLVSARPLQQVKKGEPILSLKNIELQSQLQLSIGRVREKESELRTLRARSLRSVTSLSEQIAIGESALQSLKDQQQSLEDQVNQLSVVAPRDGIVLPVSETLAAAANSDSPFSKPLAAFEPGNSKAWLPVGMPVCSIGDPQTLEAVMSISEERVAFVREEMEVKLKPVAFANRTIDAKVIAVQRSAIAPDLPNQSQQQGGVASAMAAAAVATPSNQYFATADLGNADDLGLKIGSRGKAKIRCGNRSLFSRLSRWMADTFRFQ